jgi:hypothetical protein
MLTAARSQTIVHPVSRTTPKLAMIGVIQQRTTQCTDRLPDSCHGVLDRFLFCTDQHGFVRFGSIQLGSKFVRSEGSGFGRCGASGEWWWLNGGLCLVLLKTIGETLKQRN